MGNINDIAERTVNYQTNSRKVFHQRGSRSKPKHHNKLPRRWQMKDLNVFLKMCDDFENALKNVKFRQRSVQQRYQRIHKVLVEKMAILENSVDNDSKETKEKKEMSKGVNKSLSSSTDRLSSKKSSKEEKGFANLLSIEEFFERVNCPFCEECQMNKSHLIRHLDESCLSFKKNSFKKEYHLPYAALQILPGNFFKCNICPNKVLRNMESYLDHLNNSIHYEQKNKRSSKQYTDSLFCSLCKFLIPNNFTQLTMHLEHERHKKRCNKYISEKIFQERKICCIYYLTGEYYCIMCSKKFNKDNNLYKFMDHLSENEHKQNLEKHSVKETKVYCEFCEKQLNAMEIWNHFRSVEHQSKILEEKFTPSYTLCLFCSSDFSDLIELSNHMKRDCKEMEVLRKVGLISDSEASGKSTKIEEEVTGKPEVKNGHWLFVDVSDDLNVSDVTMYFAKFGRVIFSNKVTGNKFMFVFEKRIAVDKILALKDPITINNKIVRVSESLLENVENQSNESESDEENDTTDDNSSSDDGETKNLLQEVGNHLLKSNETMDSAENDEILALTEMTLKSTTTFSSFLGCQLYLPNERKLNLHCQLQCEIDFSELKDSLFKKFLFLAQKDSVELISALSQAALKLIDKSEFWGNAECIWSSIPYVKCTHKRTEKLCIITFSESDKELTDALSACLKKNDFIKPFILTLKLWLSSQETFLSDIEYPAIAVILFFLMSKSIVRPFEVLEHPCHSKILRALPGDNDLGATKPVINVVEEENILKLFQMFLEFLNTFDFEKYAICFPITRPVPRNILTDILDVKDYSSDRMLIMNTYCTWNYASKIREEQASHLFELVSKTLQEI